jgi:predicted DNA-binding antitoxin AbrB/MazE fold protein
MLVISAFFEDGKFVPESPVSVPEKTRATITIEDTSERMAWNEIPRVRAASGRGSLEILRGGREERL